MLEVRQVWANTGGECCRKTLNAQKFYKKNQRKYVFKAVYIKYTIRPDGLKCRKILENVRVLFASFPRKISMKAVGRKCRQFLKKNITNL